jgi:protein-S-isoprenylcysteine O-methyltransferase Ste14
LISILTQALSFADFNLPTWMGWVGALFLATAVFLMGRAYYDLGSNWSPRIEVKEDQQLVTRGIYRQIRHPVYAGMWFWGLANSLLLQNWIAGFALLIVYLPLYIIRVPREEQMMLDQFGAAYQHYMNRTGRILPRVAERSAD